MTSADARNSRQDDTRGRLPIQCEACQSALHSSGRKSMSFLLVDNLTVPLVGCDNHLEQFRDVCELTTEGSAELLAHHPAGGIPCPGCRLAPHNPEQPVIMVEDGAAVVLACPDHRAEVVERFHTGLETRKQLTSSIDTSWSA